MNVLFWILQIVTALLYVASGVMKTFTFDKVSTDVPSFGALPREAWGALGVLELVCAAGLIFPSALHWHSGLTILAAILLGIESLVFIGVHVKYREGGAIAMSAILGIIMVFIAYGRSVVSPI